MSLTIGDTSESELLERIFPRLTTAVGAVIGPGDDAAVVAVPDGRVVLSIDTLVQDKDFRARWPNGYQTTGYDVGWKAAAQNLSDINAMGARPTSLVVSLTLPGHTAVEWVEAFADGLSAATRQLGVEGCGVVGGDLGGGNELVVTVAVTGSLDGHEPVLRSGARVGDVLALAGTVGRAAAGWALLESGPPIGSLTTELLHLVENQCRPSPPLSAGAAALAGGATAMLDVSDGLVRDAARLAQASSVAIDLDPAAIDILAKPLQAAAALLGTDATRWVLGGGEDHSLLATFDRNVMLPEGFTAVGSVRAGLTGVTVGSQSPANVGWDHFAD